MKDKTIYAQSAPYWRTGSTAADTWIDKAQKEIASVGGDHIAYMYGDNGSGQAAFVISFSIADEYFKLIWPVLPTRKGDKFTEAQLFKFARIQAATALYHDVKARVVAAKFLGKRGAFLNYLILPDGRTAGQVAGDEFLIEVPRMLLGTGR